jgi:small GTP-binding protein
MNQSTIKYKVLIIGDANVGKTSLLRRHVDGKFTEEVAGTIGIDYRSNTYIRDNQRYDLQIWDTAGQERFRNVTKAYYRDADATLLVFDLTNTESFKHVPEWFEQLVKESGRTTKQIVTILVGNKSDCNNINVDLRAVQDMVSRLEISNYIQTSAKVGERVDEVFEQLLEKLITRDSTGKKPHGTSGTINIKYGAPRSAKTSSARWC